MQTLRLLRVYKSNDCNPILLRWGVGSLCSRVVLGERTVRKLNEQKVQAKIILQPLSEGFIKSNSGPEYVQAKSLYVIAHALADIADTLALQNGRNE